MATKIEKIVYIHPDLAYATYRYLAYSPVESFKGNLNEMKYDVAYNSDTAPQQGENMPRYQVRDVELPQWMSVESFIRNEYFADIIFNHFGRDIEQGFYKKWQSIYQKNGVDVLLGIIKLFQQEVIRSVFRQSLKDQVMAWFNDPSPRYETPLSPLQNNYVLPFKRASRLNRI